MIADKNADIFDSFKKSSDLTRRINNFKKQPLVSFQTQKISLIDTENEVNDFHHKTALPFLKLLIKKIRDMLNLDNLPVLLTMMALDQHDIPSKEDDSFDSPRNDKIETLFQFYGKTQDGEISIPSHRHTPYRLLKIKSAALLFIHQKCRVIRILKGQ